MFEKEELTDEVLQQVHGGLTEQVSSLETQELAAGEFYYSDNIVILSPYVLKYTGEKINNNYKFIQFRRVGSEIVSSDYETADSSAVHPTGRPDWLPTIY